MAISDELTMDEADRRERLKTGVPGLIQLYRLRLRGIVIPALYITTMVIIYMGWEYSAERPLTAEYGLGYWLGIIGGSMMLLLLLYPLRKLTRPLDSVAVPALSELRAAPQRYAARFYAALAFVALITTPAVAFATWQADALVRAVADEGYTQATPIQAQAIPLILAGRDVLAAAQTGTGKTAAFTLPLLQSIATRHRTRPQPKAVRALILTPTRELALQIEENCRAYGRHVRVRTAVVLGGVGAGPQIKALRRNPDIAMELIRVLSQRLREADEQIRGLLFERVEGRTRRVLRRLACDPVPGQPGLRATPTLTHQQLADLVGTSRETITRVLKDLRDEGWLVQHGKSYHLPVN